MNLRLTITIAIATLTTCINAQAQDFGLGALDAVLGIDGDSRMASVLSATAAPVDDGDALMSALANAVAMDAGVSMVSAVGRTVPRPVPSDIFNAGPLRYIAYANAATSYSVSAAPYFNTEPGGYWQTPEWGRITSGFGYRAKFGRMHKGIDIAMNVGDTVRVPMSGVIKRTGYEPHGYGHYVVVSHDDGVETRYAHLSIPLVGEGERVHTGQPIALSGNTGNSTGPHLHFETRQAGVAIDPRNMAQYTAAVTGAVWRTGAANSAINTGANTAARPDSPAGRRTYIVRMGDTPASIARANGISLLKLCQLNSISETENLETGRMLRVR